MRNLNFKAVFLVLIIMVITNGCDEIRKSGIVPIPSQPISGAVEITPNWTEIIPPEPLKPIIESAVKIEYANANARDSFSDDGTELILAGDKRIEIEAILCDKEGKEYKLGITGIGAGIHLGLKPVSEIKNGEKIYSYPNFPKDKLFTKLKIRSQIPLKCENITWVNTVRQ